MRPGCSRYPVDRYLVESNKKVEMVNIIDDEIWNSEPALRPEDEIILKKLHDMLQSTADDLKLLSGELCKINQPGVHIKSQPAPLDEEFNERVHIEEIVNAKFHGHKIVEKTLPFSPELKPNKNLVNKLLASKAHKPNAVNTNVQVNSISSLKKEDKIKKLKTTRLKTIHINENNLIGSKSTSNPSKNKKVTKSFATVSYDEIVHEYVKPNKESTNQQLRIQNMPSINIRSELMEQKVFQLDIIPESKENPDINKANKNIGVVEVLFESPRSLSKSCKSADWAHKNDQQQAQADKNSFQKPVRKISKMSTCESSDSANNLSSDAQLKLNIQKQFKLATKISPSRAARNFARDFKNKKNLATKKTEKRSHLNIDEWKNKLNSIYGQPSSSRSRSMTSKSKKVSPKKSNISSQCNTKSKTLNNGEYIPYTKLTLGGVRVSDIEREIYDIPNKNDLQLSPILDKILSSRENSFHNDSPKNRQHNNSPKVLTTSDENLLQEVIDIEKTVSETLSKELKETSKNIQLNLQNENPPSEGSVDSYADDFEDEKSEQSSKDGQITDSGKSGDLDESHREQHNDEVNQELSNVCNQNGNVRNTTYTKSLNLSFKDTVDIFEFVHSVDTQETGTQSNSGSKISLKETQTSPRNDRSIIQPIRNDLWPSIDPKGEIESLFQLEKEFIKKLIIDEYGEIIENNIMKPSSSKEKDNEDRKNNVAAFQKNTQTSPARVKCAMTSPTRTKTRTTSPFSLSLTIDRQTSPMMTINNDELKIVIDNEPDDHGISINLSSPRFSLRLPQNSREVLSNLDNISRTSSKSDQENTNKTKQSKTLQKDTVSSSSSVDADNSSSEISSLGEVKLKLKRKIRKTRVQSISGSSSASVVSPRSSDILSGDILPLKSEGEVSLGQAIRQPTTRRHKGSEGEMNFRRLS